jgi:hypothetical protein
MLNHLQRRLISVLAEPAQATLATGGPAGVQACVVRYVVAGPRLLLLVPATSEHLINIAATDVAIVASMHWHIHGRARVLEHAERLLALPLLPLPHAPWHAVVEVQPERVTINHAEGWGAVETIDLHEHLQAPGNGQGADDD